jgi:hypothetical protein
MMTEDLLELLKKYRDKVGGRLYLDVWLELFPDGSGKLMQDARKQICKLSFSCTEELRDFIENETSDYDKIISLLKNSEYITLEMDGRTYVVKECEINGGDIRLLSKDYSGGLCTISKKTLKDAEIAGRGICVKTTHGTPCVLKTYDKKPTPNWI